MRLVVHVEAPYGLVDFVQESGRVGHDGARARSRVVLRAGWRAATRTADETNTNEHWMERYLGGTGCRRLVLDECIDGAAGRAACSGSGEGCEACDICERAQATAARRDIEVKYSEAVGAVVAATTAAPAATATAPAATAIVSVATATALASAAIGPPACSIPATTTAAMVATGLAVMLRRYKTLQEVEDVYREHVEGLRRQCVICRVRGVEAWQHSFTACPQASKWKYIEVKREVLRQTGGRWVVERYTACYRCFQPQGLCLWHETGKCDYEDMVMQTVFACYQDDRLHGWLESEFKRNWADISECLRWAGETAKLGKWKCINGVVVLGRFLQQG